MLSKKATPVGCEICTAENDPHSQQFAVIRKQTAAMQAEQPSELCQDYAFRHNVVRQTKSLVNRKDRQGSCKLCLSCVAKYDNKNPPFRAVSMRCRRNLCPTEERRSC
jgi:hypothetical protein